MIVNFGKGQEIKIPAGVKIASISIYKPVGGWEFLRGNGIIQIRKGNSLALIIGNRFWPQISGKLLDKLSGIEKEVAGIDLSQLKMVDPGDNYIFYTTGKGIFELRGRETYTRERKDCSPFISSSWGEVSIRDTEVPGIVYISVNKAELSRLFQKNPALFQQEISPIFLEIYDALCHKTYNYFEKAAADIRKVTREKLQIALIKTADEYTRGKRYKVEN